MAKKQASINKPKKQQQKLYAAPAHVQAAGLSAFWDPINNRLKPGYQNMAGLPAPGGGGSGGGAPAAPAGPAIGPSGFPEDSVYAQQVDLTRKSYDDAMAYLQKQRGQTENEYGFGTDTSNPYSQANLLERSYKQNVARTGNSYASQGQLYSGALQRGQNENLFQRDQSVDQAKRAYQALIDSFGFQEQQAGTQRDLGILGAGEAALGRAQASQPIDPGISSTPGVPNAPSATKGGVSEAEYLKGLRAIRDRHGANSPEVKRYRQRHGR